MKRIKIEALILIFIIIAVVLIVCKPFRERY